MECESSETKKRDVKVFTSETVMELQSQIDFYAELGYVMVGPVQAYGVVFEADWRESLTATMEKITNE